MPPRKFEVHDLQPGEVDLPRGGRIDGRRNPTQSLQLRKRHEACTDQSLPRWRWLSSDAGVVVVDNGSQALRIRLTIKLPQMRPGQRVSSRPVSREVAQEDFSCPSRNRGNDRTGQGAIEVCNQPEAEATRNIGISTKRDLMSPIEQRRTIVPARLVVVRCLQHKVLIAVATCASQLRSTSIAEVRQAVRNLE